jgi:hypothetical protein
MRRQLPIPPFNAWFSSRLDKKHQHGISRAVLQLCLASLLIHMLLLSAPRVTIKGKQTSNI